MIYLSDSLFYTCISQSVNCASKTNLSSCQMRMDVIQIVLIWIMQGCIGTCTVCI